MGWWVAVDSKLRICVVKIVVVVVVGMGFQGHEDRVWAIGDCAMSGQKGLPPIAPAALQQGGYVAKALNKVRVAGSVVWSADV